MVGICARSQQNIVNSAGIGDVDGHTAHHRRHTTPEWPRTVACARKAITREWRTSGEQDVASSPREETRRDAGRGGGSRARNDAPHARVGPVQAAASLVAELPRGISAAGRGERRGRPRRAAAAAAAALGVLAYNGEQWRERAQPAERQPRCARHEPHERAPLSHAEGAQDRHEPTHLAQTQARARHEPAGRAARARAEETTRSRRADETLANDDSRACPERERATDARSARATLARKGASQRTARDARW